MQNAKTQVSTNAQVQAVQVANVQAHTHAATQQNNTPNKHARLLQALAQQNQTRAQLMQASNFNAKNLSVALCNLKRAPYNAVIAVTISNNQRLYSLVTYNAKQA